MKKTLILGNGYIGGRLAEELKCEISSAKIHNLADAERLIKKYKPKVLVNCIAHIGKNVDYCEVDPDKTLIANVFVPIILAEAAIRNGVKLVHISSGCIYNYDYLKDRPITEAREPDYFDLFYSRSKIYSEQALKLLSGKFKVLILRPRVPLDNRASSKNLIDKLIKYKKVINLPNSVTYIPDFIKAVKYLINVDASGIFNVVNKGALDYAELMEEYRLFNPDFSYETIDYRSLGLKRTNLVLSTDKLEKSGFKMRNIKEVIRECVVGYMESLRK
ncbi:MAG: NAD-dependent epimerase/dehydratase family protein [Candidatus Omnitrophota bacterium]|jgi:3,5-epimerase/4-reductase|nr:MAG: NAD-dependent epimerase/dehydratase family protein [Candidatus Omnitrophota bacterium]